MRRLYELSDSQVDTGDWWPADSRFEIAVGAVLTQNTAWKNVEVAISNLRRHGLVDPQRLLNCDDTELGQLIRPSGYFNTKTSYLKALSAWFSERDDSAQTLPTAQLRCELLAIRGVGQETADDLLLYVYNRPVFIYDLYARRLLSAAGLGTYRTYSAAKRALDPLAEEAAFSPAQMARFHGLIVDAGKIAAKLGGWDYAYPLLEAHDFG